MKTVNSYLPYALIFLLAIGLTILSLRYVRPVDCQGFCDLPRGVPCPSGSCRSGEQRAGFPIPVVIDSGAGSSPIDGWGKLGPEDGLNPLTTVLDVLFYGTLLWLVWKMVLVLGGKEKPPAILTISLPLLLLLSCLLFGYLTDASLSPPAALSNQSTSSLAPATSSTPTPSPSPAYTPRPSPNPTRTPAPTPALAGELVRLPSPDGNWTAILSLQAGSLELEDPQGVRQSVFPAGSTVNDAQWSPDGKRLAVALTNLPADWQYGDEAKMPPEIHLLDFDGGAFTRAESIYQADLEAAGARILLGPGRQMTFGCSSG
ncbi:MAG: hypothetical protein P8Y14_17210 [Anaerolineales bacterium]